MELSRFGDIRIRSHLYLESPVFGVSGFEISGFGVSGFGVSGTKIITTSITRKLCEGKKTYSGKRVSRFFLIVLRSASLPP